LHDRYNHPSGPPPLSRFAFTFPQMKVFSIFVALSQQTIIPRYFLPSSLGFPFGPARFSLEPKYYAGCSSFSTDWRFPPPQLDVGNGQWMNSATNCLFFSPVLSCLPQHLRPPSLPFTVRSSPLSQCLLRHPTAPLVCAFFPPPGISDGAKGIRIPGSQVLFESLF